MRRLMCVGILVPAFGILLAGHASAGITGATAFGPGGTVTNLAIETTFTTNDSVQFDANYTAAAPIDFFLTLNGTGQYFVGSPFGNITNSTSNTFPSFYAFLVNAPAGTTFNESSWNGATFTQGTSISPPFPNVDDHDISRTARHRAKCYDRGWRGIYHIRFRSANSGGYSVSGSRS